MEQVTGINVEIGAPGGRVVVHEKQYDSGRWIYAKLYDRGTEFEIPDGADAVIRMLKPDRTACMYDASAVGVSAVTTLDSVSVDQAVYSLAYPAVGVEEFEFNGSGWENDGSAVDLAACGITYTGTPQNGDTITVTTVSLDAVQIVDNGVLFLLVDQCLAAGGKGLCEVAIFDDGNRITSFSFVVDIEPSVIDEAEIVSSSYMSVLSSLIAQGVEVLAQLPSGGVDGQVLTKFGSGAIWSNATMPTLAAITVSTTWTAVTGLDDVYSQVVTVAGGTVFSKVSLQPSPAQYVQLLDDGVTGLLVENDDGVFTMYAFGAEPTQAMILQSVVTEVGEL